MSFRSTPVEACGICGFDGAMSLPAPPPVTRPDLCPLGLDGVLVRFAQQFDGAANRAALNLAAHLTADPLPGQTEVASALVSVAVRFDRGTVTRAEVITALRARLARRGETTPPRSRRLWQIPAAFGGTHGPQLAELSHRMGRSETALRDEICAAPLQVLALGFAPGQPYLGLLPEVWDLPRQSALTPQVPAGAIVTAIRQLVLFANASPTGWRWLARTAFRPFQPHGAVPLPLAAGDALRFVPVAQAELTALLAANDPMGGARMEVTQ
jgi:KipI family sensor histidine kinase inhibitor